MSKFEKLKAKLSKNPKISNPGAVAASIGNNKFGKKTMQYAAAHEVSAESAKKHFKKK